MGIEQSVLDRLKKLPTAKQKEVLDFIDFLHHKSGKNRLLKALMGSGQILKLTLQTKTSPKSGGRCGVRSDDSSLEIAPLDLSVSQEISSVPKNIVPDMPDRIHSEIGRWFQKQLVKENNRFLEMGSGHGK